MTGKVILNGPDPFKKEPGARVTIRPWADCDTPTVIAQMGECQPVLRMKDLADLVALAADHIHDLRGDEDLVSEMLERASALRDLTTDIEAGQEPERVVKQVRKVLRCR